MTEIKPSKGKITVYASDYCVLDSDVMNGGGTDETEIIQAILDKAYDWGGVCLIMDGAALVRGIKVRSNTTIECLNSECGFYLADGADDAVISNVHINKYEIEDKNIILKGGTYNQNCANQNMCMPEERMIKEWKCGELMVAFRFFGVENFVMRDVTIIDQKRFALLMANWKNVTMDNITVRALNLKFGENQDGLHFHGPGEGLRINDCRGCSGDDFIALAPDEGDGKSSMSDIIIDGVYLEDADQGIRLLSWNEGRLDRVVIRNVFGTFKSFGFFIQPFFAGPCGNFGDIVFENINLEQTKHKYDYLDPFLFHIGGKIESLRLRNITSSFNDPKFTVINIYEAFSPGYWDSGVPDKTCIKNLTIENLHIKDSGNKDYIYVNRKVERMQVINSYADGDPEHIFIGIGDEGSIEKLDTYLFDGKKNI